MKRKPSTSRRQFIGTATAASLAAPAVLRGITPPKLRLAIIGSGGRGGSNLNGVKNGAAIAALCDTSPSALQAAAKKFPNAITATDWRELVTRDDIDGVVVSTADHHHALASVAAMRHGKHVYSEKPLAHTVAEARLMQTEYNKRKGTIATQMGTQIHATDNYRRVVELVQGGAIGAVTEAHVWCSRSIRAVNPVILPEQPVPEGFNWDVWQGPAPNRPYNTDYWKGGNLNWNRRWDYGNGVLGDMGSHLIDLPFWALQLRHPTRVEAEGPGIDAQGCPPWQEITWDHPARGSDAPTPLQSPVKVVWYHGAEGMKRRSAKFRDQLLPDTDINKWGIGVVFVGEKGLLIADYGKRILSPGAAFKDYKAPAQSIAKSTGHYNEWLQAAHTGGEALCNFDYSGVLIEHNLLGNAAYRAGRALNYDGKTGKIDDVDDLSGFLTKSYRDGWSPFK